VLDATRKPIADAAVRAVPDGHATTVSMSSTADGKFSLSLKPGAYTLKIQKDGFLDDRRTIRLPLAGVDPLDIQLQVVPIRSAVTVSESAGYLAGATATATKTLTPLRDIPQSISMVTSEQIKDQMMMSIGDVVRYVPGITAHQGENNRDQVVIRGNSSSADFFLNGVRDDVQYFRDLYNLDRVEALKGPNAMIFGRGGGGGVINRVTKEAGSLPLREVNLQGGSFGNRRFAADFDQPFNNKAAFRLNGIYENSNSFRNFVNLERYGINPTLMITPDPKTRITLSYEHFVDNRVADRGTPAGANRATFFGNPNDSRVRARVNPGSALLERQEGKLNIRNRTLLASYDRFYQNYVPGALSADKSQDSLTAYNNATARLNVFNQTDFSGTIFTGRVRHTLLAGVELGRQLTNNFRNTGYFNNTATSLLVPFANPTISTPVTFRQSVTDADNRIHTGVVATYLQDQVELSRYVLLVAGARFDCFDLQYHNNRTGETLRRIDNLVSPRAGIVLKPAGTVSVYGNYSVSYLPSSGDQFSSLTTITQQVKPEKFSNYELGIKWDVNRSLSVTTAIFKLDRTNTRATDPNDPTRIIQTGSQRTNGYELGLSGSVTRLWKIAGGYSYQDAFITSVTTSARAGAQVGQVPHHTFSLWNSFQILPRLGAGLGIVNRADMFAAVDNTVTLPGYTRADAAVYYSVTEKIRLQANVENLFDLKYYINADSNTNLSPGFPRAVRVGLIARF
jgi:catecholate siderophore receptor